MSQTRFAALEALKNICQFMSGNPRRRRGAFQITEILEPRQVLSAVTVRSLINGVETTAESRMHPEVDTSLIRTYEVRNTGTDAVRVMSIRDDGGNGFQSVQFQSMKFIASENRRDVVYDAKREILYISTSDGLVQRYDLVQNRFLSSYAVGGTPGTLDLSPNQDRLIVTNFSGPWFHLIDLTTDTFTQIAAPGADNITISAVFLSDSAYAISRSSWSQISGLPITNNPSSAVISISADRTTVGYVGTGNSGGETGRYSFTDADSATSGTGWFNWDISVSRNGQQFAVPTYNGTFIYNADMQQIGKIGTYADEGPIGVAYSPNSDIVYFAWADWDHQHAAIDAWDTKTLTRVSVIDATWRYGWTGNGFLVDGRLKISRDGQILFATAPGGVRVYGTDDLLPIFTGGDTDRDRLLDPGEVWTYRARDIARRGYWQNTVVVETKTLEGAVASSSAASWIRGVTYSVDYGDAPDPQYPTLFASDGASHRIIPGFFMGATIDQDLDAQPSALADADDRTNRDDDDGVKFLNPLVPGTSTTISVQVTASRSGWLNGWLDFNADGDWADAGEQFAVDVAVSNGNNSIPVNVPSWAVPGATFARFRLSSTRFLAATGPAVDGEVEDYRITIPLQTPVLNASPGITGTQPTFHWNSVPFAAGYEVQINVRDGASVVQSHTVVTSTSFMPTSSLGIGRYAIWVRALKDDGNRSGWSVIREFRVDLAPEPTVTIKATFDQTPEIAWTSVPGAFAYDVYIQSEKSGTRSLYEIIRGVKQNSWTPDESLPAGLYRFWIRAVNASQSYSSWSRVPATLFVGGESRILSPSGTADVPNPFTWHRVEDAVSYELWVNQIDGMSRILHETQIGTESWTPDFALPKGRYKAWMRAISGDGTVAPWSQPSVFEISGESPFRTGGLPTFDATPTWEWDAVSGVDSYDLLIQQKSTQGQFTNHLVKTGIVGASYTAESELPNGDYRIFFRNVRDGITGQWQSPPAEIHIGGRTTFRPTDLTYPESPGLSWVPVDGAVRYELQIDQIGGAAKFIHRTDLTIPFFRSDLALPKGQYTAWIRAIGPGEQPSPWSAALSFSVGIERAFRSGDLPTFDTTPTWSWPGIQGSSSYDLKFERLGTTGYEEMIIHQGLTFLQFTATSVMEPGNYRVTYRSVNSTGVAGPWQFPAATLHIGGRTSIRQVLVDQNQAVTLQWRKVEGASKSEIWVSRAENTASYQTVTIDAGSEYALPDRLSAGQYRVWIRSMSAEGTFSPWSEPASFRVT